jgi:hypothetical protein
VLSINRESPRTREEVIEFIKSLPAELVCTHIGIEFAPDRICQPTLIRQPDPSADKCCKVTLTFERDWTHNDQDASAR